MNIKQVAYTVEGFITTKNGAIWKKHPTTHIEFCVDERSYACDMYDLLALFKNKKQIEKIFNKKMAMISPYDIIELCDVMEGTQYNTCHNKHSSKISGIYDFTNLNIDSNELESIKIEKYPIIE